MSILGHLRRRPSLSHHSLKTSDGEYDDDDDESDDEDDADNYNNEVDEDDEDDMDNKDEEDGSVFLQMLIDEVLSDISISSQTNPIHF